MLDSPINDRVPRRNNCGVVLSLGCLGVLSALLSILIPVSLYFLGAWLGLVVSFYLWRFRGLGSPLRALGFTLASALAYYAAVMASMFAPLRFQTLDFLIHDSPPRTDQLLTGGIVGGFIAFLAFFVLFSPRKKKWRAPLEALLWALPCGLLGVAGWALGPVVGKVMWSALQPLGMTAGESARDAPSFYSLYLVWQTGTGLLLGLALVLEEENPASAFFSSPLYEWNSQLKRRFSVIAKLLLGFAVALTLGWYLSHTLPGEYAAWRTRRTQAQHLARAPSLANLPAPETVPLNNALVLHEIEGCTPDAFPYIKTKPATASHPSTVSYVVGYGPKSSVENYVSPRVAIVEVRQYPNAAWARFDLVDMPFSPAGTDNSVPITMFGSQIRKVQQTGQGGDLFYYWDSGKWMVTIEIEGSNADPEPFLKEYLNKYPNPL